MRPANLVYEYEGIAESAHPTWVVHEDDARIALWEPTDTVSLHTRRERGGPRSRNLLPGQLDAGFEEKPWHGDGVLKVHERGRPWSVWRWLTPRGWRGGYYVNLEEPWRATTDGWHTEDWILDVVVADDLSWHLKDEDEFQWAAQTQRFAPDLVVRIREAADAALDQVRAAAGPFAEDWDRWLPLPAALPELRAGWDAG